MMWNLCYFLEVYEQSPNNFKEYFRNNFSSFDDKATVVKILNLEYEPNNIAENKAIKWCSSFFDVFEEELLSFCNVYEDLGESLFHFMWGNEDKSNLTLKQMDNLLSLDCNRFDSNNTILLREAITNMSRIELKWFIRFWLRKPRIGIMTKNLTKGIAEYYQNDTVHEWAKLHPLSYIVECLEDETEPESNITVGQFIKPMLAKPRPGKRKFTNTIVDYKFDGNRYQIHKNINTVSIFNRKGKRVTDKFPDVLDMALKWPDTSVILDCEFYPVDTTGRPLPHHRMATRVHSKDVLKAVEKCPIEVVAFDILFYNNENLMERSQLERKQILSKTSYPHCKYHYETEDESFNINALYNMSIEEGFEGIMLKDATSKYDAGRRSNSWWKYKPAQYELDVVIVKGKMGTGNRMGLFGSFGVAVLNNGNYEFLSYVGTGLSDADLERLTGRLRKNIEKVSGTEYFFLPRIVLTVVFEAITKTDDGYGIRFPRVKSIREDKYASEINTLQDIMEMI